MFSQSPTPLCEMVELLSPAMCTSAWGHYSCRASAPCLIGQVFPTRYGTLRLMPPHCPWNKSVLFQCSVSYSSLPSSSVQSRQFSSYSSVVTSSIGGSDARKIDYECLDLVGCCHFISFGCSNHCSLMVLIFLLNLS